MEFQSPGDEATRHESTRRQLLHCWGRYLRQFGVD